MIRLMFLTLLILLLLIVSDALCHEQDIKESSQSHEFALNHEILQLQRRLDPSMQTIETKFESINKINEIFPELALKSDVLELEKNLDEKSIVFKKNFEGINKANTQLIELHEAVDSIFSILEKSRNELNNERVRNKALEQQKIIISFFVNIFFAILAGIYSGLVVARFSRFEELRNEVKRIIHGIDYISTEVDLLKIIPKKEPSEILSISSDFLALGHKEAGELASLIMSELSTFRSLPSTKYEQFNEGYIRWQKLCRKMKPNLKVILNLKPWL